MPGSSALTARLPPECGSPTGLEHQLLARGLVGEPVSWPVIQRARIEQALSQLGDQVRGVLEAHVEGSSNQEIADSFGYASKAAVAVTISRAKKQLRECVQTTDF